MFKFIIKIDDDEKSLSNEDGIPFEKVGELLQTLFDAIDPHSGEKCTLSQISGNSYALEFETKDERYHSNFEVVHKNIQQISLDELEPKQREYAKCLKKVLGGKFYLTAINNKGESVASIKDLNQQTSIDYYYSTETLYGVLSELGGVSVETSKKHIYLDGCGYRIGISGDQDLELKPYYGTHKLRVKVRHRRSSLDGHIISAEMTSFTVVDEGDIIDNIKAVGYVDFALIRNTHSVDEIVKRIYDGIE